MPVLRFLLEEPSNILIVGPIFAILLLDVQLFLCLKARNLAVKLLPTCLILLGAVLCLGLACGLFGRGGGFLDGASIAALILILTDGIAALGVLLGWGIYAAVLLSRRQRAKKS